MASLTKVLSTTSAIMTFYQRGELDMGTKVADPRLLGPAFGNNGKDEISVLNCMLHNAGYPPDTVPNYWDPLFGCPQTGPLCLFCTERVRGCVCVCVCVSICLSVCL